MRKLRRRGWEAEGQVTRRIDLSGQNACDGRSAADAWIEGFEDRGNLLCPRHEDRTAAFDDNNRLRIGLRHSGDERILIALTLKVTVRAFAIVLSDEDDRRVGSRGECRG